MSATEVFHDRRYGDDRSFHYQEGRDHALNQLPYKGYGGRGAAINYGAGYKAGVNDRIASAVQDRQPCPMPGCGKKHRSVEAAIEKHKNSPFPGSASKGGY